jgi:hypothetical protein
LPREGAHPQAPLSTSTRSTGFCVIWNCFRSSSMFEFEFEFEEVYPRNPEWALGLLSKKRKRDHHHTPTNFQAQIHTHKRLAHSALLGKHHLTLFHLSARAHLHDTHFFNPHNRLSVTWACSCSSTSSYLCAVRSHDSTQEGESSGSSFSRASRGGV